MDLATDSTQDWHAFWTKTKNLESKSFWNCDVMEQCITWSPSYTTLFMLYVIKQYNVLGASSYNGVQNFLTQGLNWQLLQLLRWQSMGVTKSRTRLSDWIELNYGSESHHIHNPVHSQRLLFSRRKTMTNLDSILKSRDIALPMKVSILKAMVFPVLMLSCFSCVQFFATVWTVAHQSSVHGILQARILEWVAISFSNGRVGS